MATTTTNNGWDIPQSSDYVKQGATAIATLGQDIDTAVGTGLLAWTSYTPTFTNFTLGNGSISFADALLGKNVFVRAGITFGTTSTFTASQFRFSLPVTAVGSAGNPIVGTARYNDTGTTAYIGAVELQNTTTGGFIIGNASATYLGINAVASTIPHTWASTDDIRFYLTYQAL